MWAPTRLARGRRRLSRARQAASLRGPWGALLTGGRCPSRPLAAKQLVRDKMVVRPAPGTRKCNCKNKVVTQQIGPGMYQQYTTQVRALNVAAGRRLPHTLPALPFTCFAGLPCQHLPSFPASSSLPCQHLPSFLCTPGMRGLPQRGVRARGGAADGARGARHARRPHHHLLRGGRANRGR